jgi:hypothetical protein
MGIAIVIVNHLRTVATKLHEILPRYTEMPGNSITNFIVNCNGKPKNYQPKNWFE